MLRRAGEADHAPDEGVVAAVCTSPVLLGQQGVQAVAGLVVATVWHLDPDLPQTWSGHAHQRRIDGVAAGLEIVDARRRRSAPGRSPSGSSDCPHMPPC